MFRCVSVKQVWYGDVVGSLTIYSERESNCKLPGISREGVTNLLEVAGCFERTEVTSMDVDYF